MPAHRKVTDEQLTDAYARTQNVWAVGEELGICGQSAHERLTALGLMNERNGFTKADEARLILEYEFYVSRGKLDQLAKSMGRTKHYLSRQARALGLTEQGRAKPYILKNERWRDRLSDAGVRRWHGMNTAQRAAFAQTVRTSWKKGWRVIGGRRIFCRSRWEANYARYLEWLRQLKEIREWKHEPKTFWFLQIKRGTRSYLPDFLVIENNGSEAYHEVKGWMDPKSRVKLDRMRKYHPMVKVVLIDANCYRAIAKKVKGLIPEWE